MDMHSLLPVICAAGAVGFLVGLGVGVLCSSVIVTSTMTVIRRKDQGGPTGASQPIMVGGIDRSPNPYWHNHADTTNQTEARP